MVLHDPVVRLPPRALSQKDPTRSPAQGGFRSDLSSRSSRGRMWRKPGNTALAIASTRSNWVDAGSGMPAHFCHCVRRW